MSSTLTAQMPNFPFELIYNPVCGRVTKEAFPSRQKERGEKYMQVTSRNVPIGRPIEKSTYDQPASCDL